MKTAIAGEHHEFMSMYPESLKAAEDERHAAATTSFRFALAVERIHHDLYSEALKTLGKVGTPAGHEGRMLQTELLPAGRRR